MICNSSANIGTLPTLPRVGGDTTPVVLHLTDKAGRPVPYSLVSTATAVMSIAPTSAGTGESVTIDGVVSAEATTNAAIVTFEFDESDTVGMVGRFIYQVDIAMSGEHRIGQGRFDVYKNIAEAST